MQPKPSTILLPVIVFAQFAGTSLWFAGNAIIAHIPAFAEQGTAAITSVVQFGFIAGTLFFSLFNIADRFAAHRVFFLSCCVAAAANLLLIPLQLHTVPLMAMRSITGFFLAGIYPVGMKIAAEHFPEKLGNALGYLVGALVLGTAFPHLVSAQLDKVNWQLVLTTTSLLAVTGGLMVLLTAGTVKKTVFPAWNIRLAIQVFRSRSFKGAAFGYFGHMWELYAFWAFVPFMIQLYNTEQAASLPEHAISFYTIAAGCLGCIAGGWLSKNGNSARVAFYALLISGFCCLFSPFIFLLPLPFFIFFLFIWGTAVVADSPQFSTLVAQNVQSHEKGTALTIVTCIGFSITILSIQLLGWALQQLQHYGWMVLLPGPILGLAAMKKNLSVKRTGS